MILMRIVQRDVSRRPPVRDVMDLQIIRNQDLIIIDVQANAFLHHMVRNIVGVLLEIGDKRREPEWADAVLQGKDRALAGVTARPNGLYLIHVIYPEEHGLSTEPRFPLLTR